MNESPVAAALAGAVSALALVPMDVAIRRSLGREPAFDLAAVTRRLLRRVLGREPRDSTVAAVQWPLRVAYGSTLGPLLSLPVGTTTAALGITALEEVAMPLVGATPPVSTWSRAERWLLLAHVAAFAVATRGLSRLVARRR